MVIPFLGRWILMYQILSSESVWWILRYQFRVSLSLEFCLVNVDVRFFLNNIYDSHILISPPRNRCYFRIGSLVRTQPNHIEPPDVNSKCLLISQTAQYWKKNKRNWNLSFEKNPRINKHFYSRFLTIHLYRKRWDK